MHSIKNISEEIISTLNQELTHMCIRRKKLISKRDYNLNPLGWFFFFFLTGFFQPCLEETLRRDGGLLLTLLQRHEHLLQLLRHDNAVVGDASDGAARLLARLDLMLEGGQGGENVAELLDVAEALQHRVHETCVAEIFEAQSLARTLHFLVFFIAAGGFCLLSGGGVSGDDGGVRGGAGTSLRGR